MGSGIDTLLIYSTHCIILLKVPKLSKPAFFSFHLEMKIPTSILKHRCCLEHPAKYQAQSGYQQILASLPFPSPLNPSTSHLSSLGEEWQPMAALSHTA